MEKLSESTDFKNFLVHVARNGYAIEGVEKRRESDGSDTIEITDGSWQFHDSYFTSKDARRFHGREVVFEDGQPVWFMGYSGFVTPAAGPDATYAFLKRAMLQPDSDLPIRGPVTFQEDSWEYDFSRLNDSYDLDQFAALETIAYEGTVVYVGMFNGGKVD